MRLDEKIDLVVVDGSALLWRSYYAFPTLKTTQNEPTGALFGVLNGMLRAYRRFPNAATVLVWDGGGTTWRHRCYPEYKANRTGQIDPRIRQQVETQREQLIELLDGLLFRQFRMPGVEADDVIGLLVRRAHKKDLRPRIVVWSGDKDFNQLLTTGWTYRLPEQKAPLYKESDLEREFGIRAYLWPQVRALAGDPVDNIKGVPGVGMKTAVKWIRDGLRVDGKELCALGGDAKMLEKAYKKINPEWKMVQLWYRLSKLPWRSDEVLPPVKPLGAMAQNLTELREWLVEAVRQPGRSERYTKRMGQQLLEFCTRFELWTIREKRNEFWNMK